MSGINNNSSNKKPLCSPKKELLKTSDDVTKAMTTSGSNQPTWGQKDRAAKKLFFASDEMPSFELSPLHKKCLFCQNYDLSNVSNLSIPMGDKKHKKFLSNNAKLKANGLYEVCVNLSMAKLRLRLSLVG